MDADVDVHVDVHVDVKEMLMSGWNHGFPQLAATFRRRQSTGAISRIS